LAAKIHRGLQVYLTRAQSAPTARSWPSLPIVPMRVLYVRARRRLRRLAGSSSARRCCGSGILLAPAHPGSNRARRLIESAYLDLAPVRAKGLSGDEDRRAVNYPWLETGLPDRTSETEQAERRFENLSGIRRRNEDDFARVKHSAPWVACPFRGLPPLSRDLRLSQIIPGSQVGLRAGQPVPLGAHCSAPHCHSRAPRPYDASKPVDTFWDLGYSEPFRSAGINDRRLQSSRSEQSATGRR
jgi:hypothetical protein